MKKIIEMVQMYPEITVNIRLSDLIECNKQLICEARTLEKEKQQKPQELFLTVSETAQLLKVNKSTLWRWNKRGYLKPVPIGGKRVYKVSDIEKIRKGGAQ